MRHCQVGGGLHKCVGHILVWETILCLRTGSLTALTSWSGLFSVSADVLNVAVSRRIYVLDDYLYMASDVDFWPLNPTLQQYCSPSLLIKATDQELEVRSIGHVYICDDCVQSTRSGRSKAYLMSCMENKYPAKWIWMRHQSTTRIGQLDQSRVVADQGEVWPPKMGLDKV